MKLNTRSFEDTEQIQDLPIQMAMAAHQMSQMNQLAQMQAAMAAFPGMLMPGMPPMALPPGMNGINGLGSMMPPASHAAALAQLSNAQAQVGK